MKKRKVPEAVVEFEEPNESSEIRREYYWPSQEKKYGPAQPVTENRSPISFRMFVEEAKKPVLETRETEAPKPSR